MKNGNSDEGFHSDRMYRNILEIQYVCNMTFIASMNEKVQFSSIKVLHSKIKLRLNCIYI